MISQKGFTNGECFFAPLGTEPGVEPGGKEENLAMLADPKGPVQGGAKEGEAVLGLSWPMIKRKRVLDPLFGGGVFLKPGIKEGFFVRKAGAGGLGQVEVAGDVLFALG